MSKNYTPPLKIHESLLSNKNIERIEFIEDIKMKKIIVFLALTMASSAFAKQTVAIAPINLHVSASDALYKFEKTILYPEALLKRYTPVGAKISKKQVSQNVISFVATKSVLFISKSVYVNALIETSSDDRSCARGETGFSLRMQFDSSDDLVTNNVEGLEAIICIKPQSSSKLTANVRSKIVLGNNYSSVLGPTAVNLIKEQVSPLLNALAEEINSL